MKKKIPSDKIWLVVLLTALAMVLATVLIARLVMESSRIREFKVDVFVLSTESDICMAEGPDGLVKMNNDNLPALYALIQKSKGRVVNDYPEALDTVVFNFECHDEDWTMTVDKISDEVMRINLEGPRNYLMYLGNNQTFESFQKAASEEGYVTKNKVMPISN